jgi:hypothetical protein
MKRKEERWKGGNGLADGHKKSTGVHFPESSLRNFQTNKLRKFQPSINSAVAFMTAVLNCN